MPPHHSLAVFRKRVMDLLAIEPVRKRSVDDLLQFPDIVGEIGIEFLPKRF